MALPIGLKPRAHAEWGLYKNLQCMGPHEILPPGEEPNRTKLKKDIEEYQEKVLWSEIGDRSSVCGRDGMEKSDLKYYCCSATKIRTATLVGDSKAPKCVCTRRFDCRTLSLIRASWGQGFTGIQKPTKRSVNNGNSMEKILFHFKFKTESLTLNGTVSRVLRSLRSVKQHTLSKSAQWFSTLAQWPNKVAQCFNETCVVSIVDIVLEH